MIQRARTQRLRPMIGVTLLPHVKATEHQPKRQNQHLHPHRNVARATDILHERDTAHERRSEQYVGPERQEVIGEPINLPFNQRPNDVGDHDRT